MARRTEPQYRPALDFPAAGGLPPHVDVGARVEKGRSGGRPLAAHNDALGKLQDLAGWEEQVGERVVRWVINDVPRRFLEWVLLYDGSILAENALVLPARGDMPAVVDLVQVPLGQDAFIPNHITVPDKVLFQLQVAHLQPAPRDRLRALLVRQRAGALEPDDAAELSGLVSKAIRSLSKALCELGYHVRTGSGGRRGGRLEGHDGEVEFVLRRPAWNTSARASAYRGKSGLGGARAFQAGAAARVGGARAAGEAPAGSNDWAGGKGGAKGGAKKRKREEAAPVQAQVVLHSKPGEAGFHAVDALAALAQEALAQAALVQAEALVKEEPEEEVLVQAALVQTEAPAAAPGFAQAMAE